jgi:hypothetical protein
MAHPRRYEDDDPVLQRLRAVALAFPGAQEVETHGLPTFRVGKIFSAYGQGAKGRPHPRSVLFKADEEDRVALEHDPRVFLPAYYGPFGWLGLDLDDPGTDWQEVAELLDSSYRSVAPRPLLARLDAEGGPAGRPVPHSGG